MTGEIHYWTKQGKKITNSFSKIPWNELHRKDGPAYIVYTEDGYIQEEEWYYKNGIVHRTGGPACIYYKNNKVVKEIYRQNNWLHRIDGPAVIEYDSLGNIKEIDHHLMGFYYTEPEFDFIISQGFDYDIDNWTKDQRLIFGLEFS